MGCFSSKVQPSVATLIDGKLSEHVPMTFYRQNAMTKVFCVRVSPDGQYLLVLDKMHVVVFRISDGACVQWNPVRAWALACAWSKDGKHFFVGIDILFMYSFLDPDKSLTDFEEISAVSTVAHIGCIDTHPDGTVLATELKNNSCKLAKWTAQSLLAGVEQMKIGYVSRVARTNPYEHVILSTKFYKPREFATQITLTMNNTWGIVKMLVDKFMGMDDGKYVIVKDPNKPILRIYSVPPGTFEDDEDEEDEDEEVGEEDDES